MRLAPLFALAFSAAASAQAPDTLDWHRYYPLAVGNAWEYHDAEMWGAQFRHTLVADTVVSGQTYFVRRTDFSSLGSPVPPGQPRVDYVRYDEAGGGVVAVASLDDDAPFQPCSHDGFERDLRLGFGARRACEPSPGPLFPDSVFAEGQYATVWQPDVLSGPAMPVDVAAVKSFITGSILFTTFVADVGPVRTGNLGGPSLHHAVVGGVAYGTPEIVVEEPGGPLTATDATVALPDDLTFTLANLTPAPVVLDSLVMRFGDDERTVDSWIVETEGAATPAFGCGFFNGDPFPGVPRCELAVALPPGAVVRVQAFYDVCAICHARGASGGLERDTLLVYSGGVAEPDVVVFDDSGYVGAEDAPAPSSLSLRVGPNPSAGRASVTLTSAAPVVSARVVLVDALGRRVAVLHDGALPGGDAGFSLPSRLPAGVYSVRAEATGGATATARLTVVR